MSVVNASRSALTHRNVYKEEEMDIRCKMAPLDNVLIGSDFVITILLSNINGSTRTLKGQMIVQSINYTGRRTRTIKHKPVYKSIGSRKEEHITLSLSANEYLDHVTENAALKISLVARVLETEHVITLKDDFRLRIPDLQLELLTKTPKVGSSLKCRIHLKNPFKTRTLTNCTLDVEGPGLKAQKTFAISAIKSDSDFTGILELTPLKPGLKQIYAILECDQLLDIKGVEEVFVYAK